MEKVTADVLIIGAGAAGIRAAIAACENGADVILVAADDVTCGGSTFSDISKGWGIQALVGAERSTDNLERFYDDVQSVGLGRSDPKLVRLLVEESGARVDDLMRYGLQFRKSPGGKYIRAKGCFSIAKRAFLTADFSNIRETFQSLLHRSPVRIMKGYAADLILDDGTCNGAWIINTCGSITPICAKSTILATGGGSGVYMDHMGNGGGSSDGYALAHLAGASLINMEFIQFALGLKNNGTRKFLPIGQLEQGDKIINSSGGDILTKSIPDSDILNRILKYRKTHMPFSCRDSTGLIDIAVAKALRKNDQLFWHNTGSLASRFKVVHFAHAFNGGVKINEQGESTIPGLFAAGEVAAGPHGADRIGGCMMTATQVFGKRAGQFAAHRATKCRKKISPAFQREGVDPCYQTETDHEVLQAMTLIMKRVKGAMGQYAGVLRSKKSLKKCRRIIDISASQLKALELFGVGNIEHYYRTRNTMITANLVVEAALARHKSKGSHYREDDR